MELAEDSRGLVKVEVPTDHLYGILLREIANFNASQSLFSSQREVNIRPLSGNILVHWRELGIISGET
jgi:hypothetical protein